MRNANLTFIRTALSEIGAPIPAAFARTADETEKILAAHRDLVQSRTFGYTAIADAWASAVLDDRDPSTDPGIIRALVASALADGDVGYAASNTVEQRLVAELPDLLDGMMRAFQDATAKANTKLTAAHQILGDTRLDEINTLHNLGPAALQASIDVQDANRIIRVVDNAWRALAELTHFAPAGTPVLLRFTRPDIEQWDKLRNVKDAWVYIQHGLTLELATTRAEVNSRQEHVDTTRTQRDTNDAHADRLARTSGLRFK